MYFFRSLSPVVKAEKLIFFGFGFVLRVLLVLLLLLLLKFAAFWFVFG